MDAQCAGSDMSVGLLVDDLGLTDNPNAVSDSDIPNEVLVQVLIPGIELTGQWQNTQLAAGSPIVVSTLSVSTPPQYWIWERNLGLPVAAWSFKPNRDGNLYIGLDNSSNLVMKAATERLYFVITVGNRGGIYIRSNNDNQQYIGMNEDNKLVLTSTPTEWTIATKKEMDPAQTGARHNILIIRDGFSTRKWAADVLTPNASILVTTAAYQDVKSHWYSEFYPNDAGWRFRSMKNKSFFVSVDVPRKTVVLQTGSAITESTSLIKSIGSASMKMMGAKGNYIAVDKDTSTLNLEADKRYATSWSFELYGFGIGGQVYPKTSDDKNPAPSVDCVTDQQEIVELQSLKNIVNDCE